MNPDESLLPTRTCLMLAAWLVCATPAQAVDLLPGEIRHPDPGVSLIQVSQQYSEREDRYINGVRHPGPAFNAAQFQVRAGHTFKLGEQPAFAYAQLPVGYVHPEGSVSGMPGDSGLGDGMVALAYWPYSNRLTETYFGVAGYLQAPTGSYSSQRLFNVGDNRWAGALQAGVQKQFSTSLLGMAAIDTSWFGENDEYGPGHATQDRKPVVTSQVALRYTIDSTFAVGANYYRSLGGETRINGQRQHDRMDLDRYQLSLFATLSIGRIVLQYGGDLDTDNGFKEQSRWIVRYIRSF